MKELYPLTFLPNVHTALWGTESWEISGLDASPSIVAEGHFAGRSLADIVAEYGAAFTGTRAPCADRLPLLFKVIDTHLPLSVQVHPDASSAGRLGGEPKTEMWHILGGEGEICAGFRERISKDAIGAAAQDGTLGGLLAHHSATPGTSFFIPAGLVHAIGANVRLYEVQQSSDTTYRLYDWGRLDAGGKPRPLHIQEALAALDETLPPPSPQRDVGSAFFNFRIVEADGTMEIAADPETFTALYITEGRRSVLVPANCAVSVPCSGKVLVTTL